jgi:hypothetical protein
MIHEIVVQLVGKINDKRLRKKALKPNRRQLPEPENTLVQDMRRLYAASLTNVTLRINGEFDTHTHTQSYNHNHTLSTISQFGVSL